MSAVIHKAWSDLRRRRLQAVIVFVTALLAVTTATIATTLMSQTRDPYQTAFAAQRGAHLQIVVDGSVDPARIAATSALVGAAASGGPYRTAPLQVRFDGHKAATTAIGRDNPGGAVEQLRITAGRWPTNNLEIAVTRWFADANHLVVGDSLKAISVATAPMLRVVATVSDIDEGGADIAIQNAWVLPTAIAGLTAPKSGSYEMLYRFAGDPTKEALQADLKAIRGVLPPGSVTASNNYIDLRMLFNITNQITSVLFLAFSVVMLLATVAIVVSLVTGIVISAYREIGIMKAIGFTPMQVEFVFVLQILMVVVLAAAVGLPLGTIASQPLVTASWKALGLAYEPNYSPALDTLVLAGTLLVVAVAAFLPALRAGRLRPAAVLSMSSSPTTRSGRWLRRAGAALRLPGSVSMGVGDSFARPARALLALATIFLGVATATLALGVPRSFATIVSASSTGLKGDVLVRRSPALSDGDATRVITAAGSTAQVVGEVDRPSAVPGIGDPVAARFFRRDPSQIGFLLVSGRWPRGAGETVAPRALMLDAHLAVGDRLTIAVAGKPISLLLVGDVLDASNGGHSLMMDLSSLQAIEPDAVPDTYLVALRPGSDVSAYVRQVSAAEADLLQVQRADVNSIGIVQSIQTVLFVLAAVMIVIAVAGIFNTLLLNARERARDTAVLKALGMSPRQVMLMVASSAAPLALIAGVLAVPAGIGLDRLFMTILGTEAGGNDIPTAVYQVFNGWELVAIALAGMAVAVTAALIPGRWVARTNVIAVLHAE